MSAPDRNVNDIFGVPITLKDYVACTRMGTGKLFIGTIVKITEVMVRVKPITGRYTGSYLIYPSNCIKVDESAATMYAMRRAPPK